MLTAVDACSAPCTSIDVEKRTSPIRQDATSSGPDECEESERPTASKPNWVSHAVNKLLSASAIGVLVFDGKTTVFSLVPDNYWLIYKKPLARHARCLLEESFSSTMRAD